MYIVCYCLFRIFGGPNETRLVTKTELIRYVHIYIYGLMLLYKTRIIVLNTANGNNYKKRNIYFETRLDDL